MTETTPMTASEIDRRDADVEDRESDAERVEADREGGDAGPSPSRGPSSKPPQNRVRLSSIM